MDRISNALIVGVLVIFFIVPLAINLGCRLWINTLEKFRELQSYLKYLRSA